MMASRMIPALWLRFIVLIGFTLFMLWESTWIISLIGIALTLVTAWQLRTAYMHRPQRENT